MMTFFVNAPPTKASVVPEDFTPKGPGYLVAAENAAAALRTVMDFRKGAFWTLAFVEVVR